MDFDRTMRIPLWLTQALNQPSFETALRDFCIEEGWVPSELDFSSDRFLSRSVLPHLKRLSQHFNRLEKDDASHDSRLSSAHNSAKSSGQGSGQTSSAQTSDGGIEAYWKSSQNADHIRLAYFLAFFPSNFMRTAGVLCEVLDRTPRIQKKLEDKSAAGTRIKVLELGSGPAASSAALFYLADKYSALKNINFAWIESDKKILSAAKRFLTHYAKSLNRPEPEVQLFHRKLFQNEGDSVLPPKAPQFDFIFSSFFWNELSFTPQQTAESIQELIQRHLAPGGLFIWIDPALKLQSRRVLETRAALLEKKAFQDQFQILFPCLGHQKCGALAKPEDWCHEEVVWWRPPYLRKLDSLAGLDHRRLPFSYLVIEKKQKIKSSEEPRNDLYRLVSPSHYEGKTQEFYICGKSGKHRARLLISTPLSRGDILSQVQWQTQPSTNEPEQSASNTNGNKEISILKINKASVELNLNPQLNSEANSQSHDGEEGP